MFIGHRREAVLVLNERVLNAPSSVCARMLRESENTSICVCFSLRSLIDPNLLLPDSDSDREGKDIETESGIVDKNTTRNLKKSNLSTNFTLVFAHDEYHMLGRTSRGKV